MTVEVLKAIEDIEMIKTPEIEGILAEVLYTIWSGEADTDVTPTNSGILEADFCFRNSKILSSSLFIKTKETIRIVEIIMAFPSCP